jgi:hypothetical protein
MGAKNSHRLLVRKPEGTRPLGRPRRLWVENVQIDLGEVEFGGVDWTGLAQDTKNWRAVVKAVINLDVS